MNGTNGTKGGTVVRRLRRVVLVVLGTSAVLVSAVPGHRASAAPSSAFTATADARLVGANQTTAPGVVFDQLVDAGAGVAQAQLDSLGMSSAFASNPYPSGSVVLLPGLVAGVTEGAPSEVIPQYPLIAASSYPTVPEQHVGAGSLALDATSAITSSTGAATSGSDRAVATVAYDDASGTVIARAEAALNSLQVSEALTLFGVRSVTEVRRSPGGEVERTTAFEIAAVSVLGQRVAVTAQDLSLLGTGVPLGVDVAGVLAPLLDSLAEQGTTLELLPAVESTDGATSAGLRIRSVSTPPPQLASGVSQLISEITVGATSAEVTNRAFPIFAAPSANAQPGEVSAPGAAPSLGSPSTAGGAPGGAIAAPSPASPAAVPAAISVVSTSPMPGLAASVLGFYPVLVLAGCCLVGCSNLFARYAVRLP